MNRILQQFHAIFGVLMVLFYIGVGTYLVFFAKALIIDRAIKVIVGSSFLLYGFYRITVTYKQIVEAFSQKEDNQD